MLEQLQVAESGAAGNHDNVIADGTHILGSGHVRGVVEDALAMGLLWRHAVYGLLRTAPAVIEYLAGE